VRILPKIKIPSQNSNYSYYLREIQFEQMIPPNYFSLNSGEAMSTTKIALSSDPVRQYYHAAAAKYLELKETPRVYTSEEDETCIIEGTLECMLRIFSEAKKYISNGTSNFRFFSKTQPGEDLSNCDVCIDKNIDCGDGEFRLKARSVIVLDPNVTVKARVLSFDVDRVLCAGILDYSVEKSRGNSLVNRVISSYGSIRHCRLTDSDATEAKD